MTEIAERAVQAPIVTALRKLSVFGADQAGAYREHFSDLADVLGPDVRTKLASFLEQWACSGSAGVVLLTGNAGTGKTAAAEAYCAALGGRLPSSDELVELAAGRWVVKDLSGLATPEMRAGVLAAALRGGVTGQALVCANEGILRDALGKIDAPDASAALAEALRVGAAKREGLFVVNVNRQRPTGDGLWDALLDYLTRDDLWEGCNGCPFDDGGCAMRENATQLRRPEVRGQLRALFRLATGEAVPTLREVLAILSWAIVGDDTCERVKGAFRDRGKAGSTAADAYFARLLGSGLTPEAAERSPLMSGLQNTGLGQVSDLQVDGWLRDSSSAPHAVQQLAGSPSPDVDDASGHGLQWSSSPLDRVNTRQQQMTFHALGEMISTDEDTAKVDDGLAALVISEGTVPSAQDLWRRRVYFEAAAELGSDGRAGRRLLRCRHAEALTELAAKVADGGDTFLQLGELVRGLNFLVTGFQSADEGMIVPDPACLFSRDPGAFRPAAPSLVHSLIGIDRLSLEVPDDGLVDELLDIDHLDVVLRVDGSPNLALRIGPRMHEAIREAADFGGPVGQGVAEMNDLRSFYGLLSEGKADHPLRIADPSARPPALPRVTLPHHGAR